MKRTLIIISVILLTLTACGKSNIANISTTVENLKTVKTALGTDKDQTDNYQGYISIKTKMTESNAKNMKQVTVKKIKFSTNDKGIAVMYRYNPEFDDKAVKAIYDSTKMGNVNDIYTYTPEQFKDFGFQKTADGEYTTKIQYLIMQVKPDTKPKDIERKVTFTMVYEFNKGKAIEKNVKVNIP